MSALLNDTVATACFLVVPVTVVAAVLDVRTFRVPNWLTFPMCILGLLYHAGRSGAAGFAFSATGLVIGVLLLLLFFVIGAMGAGDIKLLAGVGAWLGGENTIWICLIACLASGFYSLGVIALRSKYGRFMTTPFQAIHGCFQPPIKQPKEASVEVASQGDDRRWRVLPFALMIAIGVVLVAVRKYGVLFV